MSAAYKLTALLLACACSAHAADTAAAWPTQAPISVPAGAAYFKLTLPYAAHTRAAFDDLHDVRIFNAAGESVPYAWAANTQQAEIQSQIIKGKVYPFPYAEPPQRSTVRVTLGADTHAVEIDEDKNTTAPQGISGHVVDLGKKITHLSSLKLDWPVQNARDTGLFVLDVSASNDLRNWDDVVRDAQILVLTQAGVQIRQTELALPDVNARYLWLHWRNVAPHSAQLAVAVTAQPTTYIPPSLQWSPVYAPGTMRVDRGEYDFALPTTVTPQRVRLSLPEGNVVLPVTLWARRAPNAPWGEVGNRVVYRLSVAGKSWTQTEFDLDPSPTRQLRIQVDTRSGGWGKTPPTLSLAIQPQALIALARGPAPFSLRLGNAKATATDLPVETLIPGYGGNAAPPIVNGHLGAFTSHAAIVTPPAHEKIWGGLTAKRWGLWAMLGLGVLMLAWMALSVIRQLNNPPATPPASE